MTPPSVAFVNPSVGFSDRRKSKPIGLAYVMAYLRSRGYPSTGFDFGDSVTPTLTLAEQHALDRYDVIGLSVYNESFKQARDMAGWIKARNPGCLVVLGGPHATAVHEHILRKYDCFDVVVRREGEEAMAEILDRLHDAPGRQAIAGTSWRGQSGEVVVNPDRGFVLDLDRLPFPDADFVSDSGYPDLTYYDEQEQRLKAAITICSSRSCPYNCSFCGVLTIGRKYRSRQAQRVSDEVVHFRTRDGIRYQHVYFSDANFFVYPHQALEIAEALHELDPAITFSFGTRINQVLKAADALARLKDLGLRFIEVGIESASPTVMERLAKNIKPEVNVAGVKLLRRLGIEISLDFIMLDPASTLDDLQANLEFLRDQDFFDYLPHDHLYSALVLYEGTPIRKFYADRYGLDFDPDELPDPFTLFEHHEVQRFSDELRAFRRQWQDRIDHVLALGELASASVSQDPSTSWGAKAQLQLDVVALRHAPNVFMERLLADAREGYAQLDAHGRSSLVPDPGHDGATLEQVLTRTAEAARLAPLDQRLLPTLQTPGRG